MSDAFLQGRITMDTRRGWVVVKARLTVAGVLLAAGGAVGIGVAACYRIAGKPDELWGLAIICGIFAAVGIGLLHYRRTVIVDPVARQMNLYNRRRLVQQAGRQ